MTRRTILRLSLLGAAMAAAPLPAHAEDDDNAVASAEDAFGTTTQHEQIGVYEENNVRGFSVGTAGNFRMEGLYFDIQGGLGGRVIDGELIRVGPAAQGYAFPAPTGIADLSLKKAGDRLKVSTFSEINSFGNVQMEFDGQIPLAGNRLAVATGIGVYNNRYPAGGGSVGFNLGIVPRWRPAPNVEILAFASHQEFNDDTNQPIFLTDGFAPPRFDLTRYMGPAWTKANSASDTFGALGHANLGNWTLRGGVFRSRYRDNGSFTNLITINPDSSTLREVYATPGNESASWSGEWRVSRRFADGPRQHLITAAVRGRSVDAVYGGGDVQTLGTAPLGAYFSPPKPVFTFGEQTQDRVRQASGGLSYSLAWKGLGEMTVGAQRTHYTKRVTLPGAGVVSGTTDAVLPYASLALSPARGLVLYGSYVRGLEDAGTAPSYAANANDVLPAIRTRQYDFGLRWSPVKDTTLIVGYFSISKPYIDINQSDVYGVLGQQTHRGIEVSLTSNPTKRLRIVAGGVWLDPRVTASPAIAQPIGLRPVGQPRLRTRFNINWTPAFAPGVTLDAYWNRETGAFATVDNSVYAPGAGRFGGGVRYRFTLAGKDVTARLSVYNITQAQFFSPVGSGVFGYNVPRNVDGWIAMDF